jgi:argininosuccinate lyase
MANKMWGGVFKKETHPAVEGFTSSIGFDYILAPYDVRASIAHTKMLAKTGVISRTEAAKLVAALTKILKEIQTGSFKFDPKYEDIHSCIESALEKKVGKTAQKLHIARSRNDQVSLDSRLYCRAEIAKTIDLLKNLQVAFLKSAKKHDYLIIPGYTHLQRAKLIRYAHYLLAYVEMLERDKQRLSDACKRIDCLPAGSAALAGTSIKIDRFYLARLLGFSKVSGNSLDAVSDRDYVAEIIFALSLLAMHLSRFAEDIIIYTSQEFGYFEIDEAFATGSSIMPHKKNPDVLELIRGLTGKLYGDLINILTVLKGLPLSYNRDLQHDKPALFEAFEAIETALQILTQLIPNLKPCKEKLNEAVKDGIFYATDVMEYLIKKDLSRREAHDTVGKIVRYAKSRNKQIADLTLAEWKRFSPQFEKRVFALFDPQKSVDSKISFGGTSAGNVRRQIEYWRKKLISE